MHLHADITASNIQKLLQKCKSMLHGRSLIFKVIIDLDKQEAMIKDVRRIVDMNLSDSIDEETKQKIRGLTVKIGEIT